MSAGVASLEWVVQLKQSVPPVWIRGPDLQIIMLYLRLSLCYFFFFAVRQLVKKNHPNNKKGDVRPFSFFAFYFCSLIWCIIDLTVQSHANVLFYMIMNKLITTIEYS